MLILAIETSCDETSAAVVRDGRDVFSLVTASSLNDFRAAGGVVPEQAARRQVEWMIPVVDEALSQAGVNRSRLDLIAVTCGPGLLGSLLIGTQTARVFASVWSRPVMGVHHTLGHLYSTWLLPREHAQRAPEPTFPILTLSVSGGHTDLWFLTGHLERELLATTRDDAAGEAFDKGAMLFGLPYPGGPLLSALAEGGDESAYHFPIPLKREHGHGFSFSGLKTSLKYLLRKLEAEHGVAPGALPDDTKRHIAASYQHAICAHLTDQVHSALSRLPKVTELHLVGGVSANSLLRRMLGTLASAHSIRFRLPAEFVYCTDNAAMIGAAAYYGTTARPRLTGSDFTTEATLDLSPRLIAG